MFPSVQLLQNEYNEGWLDANGLKNYTSLGILTQSQYSQIINSNNQQSSNSFNPTNQ